MEKTGDFMLITGYSRRCPGERVGTAQLNGVRTNASKISREVWQREGASVVNNEKVGKGRFDLLLRAAH